MLDASSEGPSSSSSIQNSSAPPPTGLSSQTMMIPDSMNTDFRCNIGSELFISSCSAAMLRNRGKGMPTPKCELDGQGCLSLGHILESFSAAINEEHAWAICFQFAKTGQSVLSDAECRKSCHVVSKTEHVRIHKDGFIHQDTFLGSSSATDRPPGKALILVISSPTSKSELNQPLSSQGGPQQLPPSQVGSAKPTSSQMESARPSSNQVGPPKLPPGQLEPARPSQVESARPTQSQPSQPPPSQLEPARSTSSQVGPAKFPPGQLEPARPNQVESAKPTTSQPSQHPPGKLEPARSTLSQVGPPKLPPGQLNLTRPIPSGVGPSQPPPSQLEPARLTPSQEVSAPFPPNRFLRQQPPSLQGPAQRQHPPSLFGPPQPPTQVIQKRPPPPLLSANQQQRSSVITSAALDLSSPRHVLRKSDGELSSSDSEQEKSKTASSKTTTIRSRKQVQKVVPVPQQPSTCIPPPYNPSIQKQPASVTQVVHPVLQQHQRHIMHQPQLSALSVRPNIGQTCGIAFQVAGHGKRLTLSEQETLVSLMTMRNTVEKHAQKAKEIAPNQPRLPTAFENHPEKVKENAPAQPRVEAAFEKHPEKVKKNDIPQPRVEATVEKHHEKVKKNTALQHLVKATFGNHPEKVKKNAAPQQRPEAVVENEEKVEKNARPRPRLETAFGKHPEKVKECAPTHPRNEATVERHSEKVKDNASSEAVDLINPNAEMDLRNVFKNRKVNDLIKLIHRKYMPNNN